MESGRREAYKYRMGFFILKQLFNFLIIIPNKVRHLVLSSLDRTQGLKLEINISVQENYAERFLMSRKISMKGKCQKTGKQRLIF